VIRGKKGDGRDLSIKREILEFLVVVVVVVEVVVLS
jgi:hypothetical protein